MRYNIPTFDKYVEQNNLDPYYYRRASNGTQMAALSGVKNAPDYSASYQKNLLDMASYNEGFSDLRNVRDRGYDRAGDSYLNERSKFNRGADRAGLSHSGILNKYYSGLMSDYEKKIDTTNKEIGSLINTYKSNFSNDVNSIYQTSADLLDKGAKFYDAENTQAVRDRWVNDDYNWNDFKVLNWLLGNGYFWR